MVQKEVRKKTKIYGTVAVLSAIILVSMIYAFGVSPNDYFRQIKRPFVSGMKTFSSLEELKNYINNTSQGSSSFAGGPLDSQFFGATSSHYQLPASALSPSTGNSQNTPATYSAQSAEAYSTTNIQVAGVDEADTVKTDGQYIYTVSTTQNTGYYFGGYNSQTSNAVYIINADPQNPQVVSKIVLGNDTEPAGLFLSQDGNKLVVLASKYQYLRLPSGQWTCPYARFRRCCNANDYRPIKPMFTPTSTSMTYQTKLIQCLPETLLSAEATSTPE